MVEINSAFVCSIVFISTVIIWILFLKIHDKNEELELAKSELNKAQSLSKSYSVVDGIPYPKIFKVFFDKEIICYLSISNFLKTNYLYTIIKIDGDAETEIGFINITHFQTNGYPVGTVTLTTNNGEIYDSFINNEYSLLKNLFVIPSINIKHLTKQGGY